MTRANVNAVVLTCTGTGYWGADVELLAEHEMNQLGYPMGAGGMPMDFVDRDGMHIGLDSNSAFGTAYNVDRSEEMNGSQVQYGHLPYSDQNSQWNYRHSLLGGASDPSLQGEAGVGLGGVKGGSGDGLALTMSGPGFNRGHQRHSRHSSKGSRDEFGSFFSPHHDRIVEDDEEESTLMAAEILNKSLSINRSYSSIRSSFLMEPSSFNSGAITVGSDLAADGQDDLSKGGQPGVGPRLGSPVPGLVPNSSFAAGRGGPGSGSGHRISQSSSMAAARNRGNQNQSHRAPSSNNGSNSSSVMASSAGTGGAGAGAWNNGRTVSGHRTRASCDDLSLSSSDEDDDEDDDSTDSDGDYSSHQSHSFQRDYYEDEGRTRENSFDRAGGGGMTMVRGHGGSSTRGSVDNTTAGEASRRGGQTTPTPGQSQPGSRPSSRPGSRTESRPGSVPASPATKRVMDRVNTRLGGLGAGEFVGIPNVYLSQK
ncbi:hypothetical protein BGZ90_004886 [Linnemannia elongata]|nr:hypothetical protein BGZ90_004886 [Linnemannia elongata]